MCEWAWVVGGRAGGGLFVMPRDRYIVVIAVTITHLQPEILHCPGPI